MKLHGRISTAGDGENMPHSGMEFMLSHGIKVRSWPRDLELEGWSDSLYARNKETEEHTLCVAEMTVMLAELAGLPQNEIDHIHHGALLHDIGKTGIPNTILLKPGRLSRSEWDIMQKHPVYAYDLIYPIEYLRPCLSIPYWHHERWDGLGYPQGLKGELIPLAARLFAVVDVWESLSSDRVYREAWTQDRVIEYIESQSGRIFDPAAVELLLHVIES